MVGVGRCEGISRPIDLGRSVTAAAEANATALAEIEKLSSELPIRLVVLACKRPIALESLLHSLDGVGSSGGYLGHNVVVAVSGTVASAMATGEAVAASEVAAVHGGRRGVSALGTRYSLPNIVKNFF